MSEQVGKVNYPLDPTPISFSIGQVTDPAQLAIADIVRTVVIHDLGDAFTKAAIGTPLEDIPIIASVIPFDPRKYLNLEVKQEFPLLAVFREKSEVSEKTLMLMQRVTDWGIIYILPPLDANEMGRMYQTLNGVASLVSMVFNVGYHVAYNDGYAFLPTIGSDWTQITTIQEMDFHTITEAQSLVYFPAIKMTLRTVEIGQDFPNVVDYEGMDLSMTLDQLPIVEAQANTITGSLARYFLLMGGVTDLNRRTKNG